MMRCDRALLDTADYSRYNPNTSKINQLRPEARGIALVKTIRLHRLDSQQLERSLDVKHTSNIKQLSTRDPTVSPVTDQLLDHDSYPAISPAKTTADPLWYDAPIVKQQVSLQINQQRIIAHAKNKGCPLLFWQNPLAGGNALLLSQAEKQEIYSIHLP